MSQSHPQNPPKTNKRKKPSSTSNQKTNVAPIFLRKTYELIDSCDPRIATWADDGLSFIVKDSDRFASESIPQCFKHNNFSSFVRQLNFYGFRKLRDDHIFLKDIDTKTAQWSAFHHPKFVRGHPEWLVEIKKTNQVEPAEKQEVDSLKAEVKSLRAEVKNLRANMELVTTLLGDMRQLLQQQQLPTGDQLKTLESITDDAVTDTKEPVKKRRKVSPIPALVLSLDASNLPQQPLPPLPVADTIKPVKIETLDSSNLPQQPLPPLPVADAIKPIKVESMQREASATLSLNSDDEAFLDTLMLLEGDGDDQFSGDDQLPPTNEEWDLGQAALQ